MIARALAAALALSAAAHVWQWVSLADTRTDLANARHAASEQLADASKATQEEEAANRETEALRRRAIQTEVDRATTDARHDARRTAGLADAAGRLREHVARLAAAASCGEGGRDPAAADGGPPATGPGLVLADLYRGADDEARELAQAFDAARRAGLTCERIHDSLTDGR